MKHPERPAPQQEDDIPQTGKVLGVALFALMSFAVGIAWVVSILRTDGEGMVERASLPPELGRSPVGIVSQSLFEEARPVATRELQLHTLRSYGWVDRERGIIHVPIAKAMDLVALGRTP